MPVGGGVAAYAGASERSNAPGPISRDEPWRKHDQRGWYELYVERRELAREAAESCVEARKMQAAAVAEREVVLQHDTYMAELASKLRDSLRIANAECERLLALNLSLSGEL